MTGVKGSVAALAVVMLVAAGCGGADAGRTSQGPSLVAIGAGLDGPAGLSATVYARGLPRVAAFAFDPQGRLWVATADLTDTGKDGLYVVAHAGAAPLEVVPRLHTPLGLVWYQGSLYVSSAVGVDEYTDFDATSFVSHRRILTLPTGVGEVNDLVVSPSGRFVMGISAPCDHCVPSMVLSAAVMSFLPDGTDLRVDASGIRAPVGLEYYPGTDDLFVTMNQRNDLGNKTPGDWLAVVRPGQDWRFPGCYGQGGAVCAGVPAPTAVLDPHGAVSDVAIVTGQLGPGVGTAAIVAEWNVDKVQRVALVKHGSSYTGTVSPLLTGVANPVAVVLGPDNALYVGNWSTGTVYRVAAAA